MQFKGRTALVTGSTSGIGLGIAHALAKEGANVILNGLASDADIAKAIADVGKHGTRVVYDPANMLRHNQIADMITKAEADFGALDILVNNAGIQHVAPVEEFPIEKWDAVIAINLSSAFHTIRAAVPGMRKRNRGRIINVCSAHSLTASPHKAAYVAAKHGLIGLAKVVAKEGAAHGVRANVICPGFVRTPLVDKQIPEQAAQLNISEEDVIKKVMLKDTIDGEFTTTQDVAQTAVFLAAFPSTALSGQSIVVSHGWHMQ